MPSHELLTHYGVLIVFINVLGSSLGLPIPATPTLIMAGAAIALAAEGFSSAAAVFGVVLGAAVIGGALADIVWFHGSKCGVLMPRRLDMSDKLSSLGRWGVRTLLIARFVPGLAFIAVLLCGRRAVCLRSFILHDCAGIGLWAAAAMAAGALSAPHIETTYAAAWQFIW